MRIAWGITGAGHLLRPCLDLLLYLENADIFLSPAAAEVLRVYDLEENIFSSGKQVYEDRSPSAIPIIGLYKGWYSLVVIAPASSNTVAKMALGISDTLITNLFAQAGKRRIPTLVLPTDQEEKITSLTQRGNPVEIYPRPIDLENVERLKRFPCLAVLKDLQELKEKLATFSSAPPQRSV